MLSLSETNKLRSRRWIWFFFLKSLCIIETDTSGKLMQQQKYNEALRQINGHRKLHLIGRYSLMWAVWSASENSPASPLGCLSMQQQNKVRNAIIK